MKKILVFGATGSVGSYLIDYLCNTVDKDEYEVIAVSRRDTDFFQREYNIKYFSMDISKASDFDVLPTEDIHSIIFLAGILPAYMQGYYPEKYIEVNTIGGLNALEYARKVKADRFIYTQSFSDLAGYFGKEKVLSPYMPLKLNYNNDHSVYVISKNTVTELMKAYSAMYGINCITLRLPNIYGYTKNQYFHVDGEIKTMAYFLMINKAIKGEDIEVWGDCSKEKDLVYVKDVAQMIAKTITTSQKNKIYNVGTGIGTSLEDMIKGIVHVFSSPDNVSKLIYCPDKPDNPEYIMNIDNAITELGYEPKYNCIDMLKDMKLEMELKRFDDLEREFIKGE